ncbi:hypothetical protein PYCC9005_004847 [Savitreella phatthalungensis]
MMNFGICAVVQVKEQIGLCFLGDRCETVELHDTLGLPRTCEEISIRNIDEVLVPSHGMLSRVLSAKYKTRVGSFGSGTPAEMALSACVADVGYMPEQVCSTSPLNTMALDPGSLLCLEELARATALPRTAAGKRRLYAWLRHPLANEALLMQRRGAVSAMTQRLQIDSTPEIFGGSDLASRLQHLASLSRFLESIRGVIVPPSTFLSAAADCIADQELDDVRLCLSALDFDVSGRTNLACYGVRSGVNGLLDATREVYRSAVSAAVEMAMESGVELKFDSRTGICSFLAPKENALSAAAKTSAIHSRRASGHKVAFTTETLMKVNARIRESLEQAIELSLETLDEIDTDLARRLPKLATAIDAVTFLDVVGALVQHGTAAQISSTLTIEQGRHPLLESVPNDVNLSSNALLLVSGPNMSGKTTYLSMLTALVIQSQAGAMVGAAAVTSPIFSGVICCGGEIVPAEASSFLTEMRRLQLALRLASDESLVVVDELGRSTSTLDAEAIIGATCMALQKTGVRAILATHLSELVEAVRDLPGCDSISFGGELRNNRMCMPFKTASGKVKNYGLEIARTVLDRRIVNRAEALLARRPLRERLRDISASDTLDTLSSLLSLQSSLAVQG